MIIVILIISVAMFTTGHWLGYQRGYAVGYKSCLDRIDAIKTGEDAARLVG